MFNFEAKRGNVGGISHVGIERCAGYGMTIGLSFLFI